MHEKYDDLYKIIIIGDSSVGKTNLVQKFVKGTNFIAKNIAPTIGVQFGTKIVSLEDGTRIKAQIWDTAGQQQYRSITMAHYRRALGALIVYDITKQRTFQSVRRWLSTVREQADQNVVIVLVGNKIDLKDKQVVSTSQGKKLAKDQGIFFQQTSAQANINVEKTFHIMLEEIQKKRKQTQVGQVKGMHLGESSVYDKNRNQCQC